MPGTWIGGQGEPRGVRNLYQGPWGAPGGQEPGSGAVGSPGVLGTCIRGHGESQGARSLDQGPWGALRCCLSVTQLL